MRKLRPTAACMALAAGLSFSSVAIAQQITIGLSLPETIEGFDFVNGMYENFAAHVEANSDMTVDLVYGGALGAPNERLGQMRRGVLEMTDAADGNYATIYSDIQVLNMPYLFETEEQAWAVLDGSFGRDMAEDIRDKTGIRVLGWWESGGFKHFSANRAIEEPADMSGMRMRVLGPLATIPVEALGASASPVAFGELYAALRTGVVDGQDNSVSTFNLVNLYEVQSHLSLTGHTYAFGPLGISEAFFEGLEEADQQVILDAAEAAIAFNRETSRAVEASAIEFAQEEGVTIVELSEDERQAFREAMQPAAIDWLRGNIDRPELIEAAIEAAEAAR